MRIELWIAGDLVDGTEQWWDEIEVALPKDAEQTFPLLVKVDPYGDVQFSGETLDALGAEVRRLTPHVSARAQVFVRNLVGLCEKGGRVKQSELRFLGD